jgi:hypothetical protein
VLLVPLVLLLLLVFVVLPALRMDGKKDKGLRTTLPGRDCTHHIIRMFVIDLVCYPSGMLAWTLSDLSTSRLAIVARGSWLVARGSWLVARGS